LRGGDICFRGNIPKKGKGVTKQRVLDGIEAKGQQNSALEVGNRHSKKDICEKGLENEAGKELLSRGREARS